MRPVLVLVLVLGCAAGGALQSPARLPLPGEVDDDRLLTALRNKVLLFIGDSVTRYQYLNLAVFVERRRWPLAYDDDESLPGSICVQKKYKNFNEFFLHTTNALNGNEMCDCCRSKHCNFENRRYYNPDLNVSLVFIFMGREMPRLRSDFGFYPFKRLCNFQGSTPKQSSGNNVTAILPQCSRSILDNAHRNAFTTHGSVLYNATQMFLPDVAIINWGHHSPFEMAFPKGKWVYKYMVESINNLNKEYNNHTRFLWKSTTPACHHANMYMPIMGQCNLTHDEADSNPPQLVGNFLVYSKHMEVFDAQKLVKILYSDIQSRKSGETRSDTEKNLTFESVMPIFTDDIHVHCWVNAELNRALIAQLFLEVYI